MVRAYNELDEIPAVVHPTLYATLDGWGFDGFKIADDDGNYPRPAPSLVPF